MIQSDFHMHSSFSSDSDTPMETMIQAAIHKGLTSICFTDHMDFDYPVLDPQHPMDFLFDPQDYVKTIAALKEQYQDKIQILTGIELGLKPGIEANVQKLVKNYDFDFIIGSSHLLYNDDPYYVRFWNKLRQQTNAATESEMDSFIVRKAIRDYFTGILSNIDTFPEFQVYGHLDYIVRYAPGKDAYYHVGDYQDILESILKKLILSGRGIEINTSGLKSGLQYANPHLDILKLYHSLGGEIITIGADAHTPEYIGYRFNRAKELLTQAGFHYYTTFCKKEPRFHLL